MRLLHHCFAALLASAAAPALAAQLDISIEIPSLDVAEYHRPYVAIWIARADHSVAGHLAVWYQQDRPGADAREPGTQWLPDLRQWWRRGGRTLTVPVDGVTGATRPVGVHRLTFDDRHAVLSTLAPGDYTLVIEAAREVGGRELLQLPLAWPPALPAMHEVRGRAELGAVSLTATP